MPESIEKAVQSGWQDDAIAEKYARAEGATKPYADMMVEKAQLADINSDISVLDLGCGTGAAAAAVYDGVPKEKWSNIKLLGGDISDPMLKYLSERGRKAGWTGLETQIVDGANIQLPKESFTHIFANAIIFFLPLGAVATCCSLLKPGGFFGMTSWASYPWYSLVERSASKLPKPLQFPSYEEVKAIIHKGSDWDEPSFIETHLKESGFVDVDIVREQKKVSIGTPAQFIETMAMPITMLTAGFPEGEKEKVVRELQEQLKKDAVEDVGEEGTIYMVMDALVATAWKAK